ncbi:(2Fe-2S)-binding protein [Longibacter salinarum]|uniref:(2Fe-2S)-binding protein n=1 Tax=Longibacter salinarum TaxID=1850348 RepID=A0A2A8CYF3_9BACT|nr:(2Fe-2S)-binding protein [Longibacter salinarum]
MNDLDSEGRGVSGLQTHTVEVFDGKVWHRLTCRHGVNLRLLLLENDLSPYVPLTENLNCGGRGLCATCGIRFDGEAPTPEHWHDKAAARFGYPRLSCQIQVNRDLSVRLLPEKRIWGKRGKLESRRKGK